MVKYMISELNNLRHKAVSECTLFGGQQHGIYQHIMSVYVEGIDPRLYTYRSGGLLNL